MEEILLLAHRIPYPPNKGDKIRSYHILRYLAERHRVRLGCFIDSEEDLQHIDAVRNLCAEVYAARLAPAAARLGSLKGLAVGQALSIPYYADRGLAEWCGNALARNGAAAVLAYSSPMAQYATGPLSGGVRRVMDFVDVDSDKWRQYADTKSMPLRWLYRRESKRLLEYERRIARHFDAVTFVSENEKSLFDKLSPHTSEKHHAFRNGVDYRYFDTAQAGTSPFPEGAKAIVFTGMMDYWPNVDAVTWFAEEVFPAIRQAMSDAQFWIVGASPSAGVTRLAATAGITVTGRVDDVRPYLAHAAVAVAPLRIARGVQNKVLEALAMRCPVVCSSAALAGLEQPGSAPVQRADDAPRFADTVLETISRPGRASNAAGPEYVRRYYDWDSNLARLERLLLPAAGHGLAGTDDPAVAVHGR